jgi:hypothetical protein
MQEASLDCVALAEFHGFDKQTDFKCMWSHSFIFTDAYCWPFLISLASSSTEK